MCSNPAPATPQDEITKSSLEHINALDKYLSELDEAQIRKDDADGVNTIKQKYALSMQEATAELSWARSALKGGSKQAAARGSKAT